MKRLEALRKVAAEIGMPMEAVKQYEQELDDYISRFQTPTEHFVVEHYPSSAYVTQKKKPAKK
jgi:hypothetical protein